MQHTEIAAELYQLVVFFFASTDVWWLLCCGESDGCFFGARWASARMFVHITVPGDRQWSGTCHGPFDGNAAVSSKDSLGVGKYVGFWC